MGGRAFQDTGPKTENDHGPRVDVSVRGMQIVCWRRQNVVDSDQEEKPEAHSNEYVGTSP